MTIDLLGPGSNATNITTTRPPETRAFGALDTWFQDCTSPTAGDGSRVPSAWLNAIKAQLVQAIRQSGVVQDNADDLMLWKAIQLAGKPYVDAQIAALLPQGAPWDVVAEQRLAANTSGAGSSIAGMQTRILDTLVENRIGATLASSVLTVPAGNYLAEFDAPAQAVNSHQVHLYNNATSTILLSGTCPYTPSSTFQNESRSFGAGKLILGSATPLALKHFTEIATATWGLGAGASGSGVGNPATYAVISRLKLRRIVS